ncbi:hypothetical protein TIFTF001_030283 [Ficus carica]|uniref:Uncharacterized protein n=1 Tax=Ficus carica TaxID=3494 RepID=A0AA88DXA5_FICCA|nr:hypothetical protein TIFTF001_030283 [Ficus carica]
MLEASPMIASGTTSGSREIRRGSSRARSSNGDCDFQWQCATSTEINDDDGGARILARDFLARSHLRHCS